MDTPYFDTPPWSVMATPNLEALKERERLTRSAQNTVIVLVGLPGRGKSFISRKLENLLKWKGMQVRVFNAGSYRRKEMGAQATAAASFYDSNDTEATRKRNEIAIRCMEDMIKWLDETEEACVAVFDATNTTKERRAVTLDMCRRAPVDIGVVFIESICDDEEVLLANFKNKVAVSPDFAGVGSDEAVADLRRRASLYQQIYEPIDDDSLSYIKLFNLSSRLLANKIHGEMSRTVVPALLAWNISTRPVFLVRAARPIGATGGSDCTPYVTDRDSPLSEEGIEFSEQLGRFLQVRCSEWHQRQQAETDNKGCKVMCSTIPRASETAHRASVATDTQSTHFVIDHYPQLNPLDKGSLYGLSMADIEDKHKDWFVGCQGNPFTTRFPGGESYLDVVNRLESVVVEMEQQCEPVLIVSHVTVLQVLVGYLLGKNVDEFPKVEIPMNCVIEVTPTPKGDWEIKSHKISKTTSIPNYS